LSTSTFPGKICYGINCYALQRKQGLLTEVLLALSMFRPPNVGREGLKFFLNELSFLLFFYQYTVLSSRAVDGHQMYSDGSVVGKASEI